MDLKYPSFFYDNERHSNFLVVPDPQIFANYNRSVSNCLAALDERKTKWEDKIPKAFFAGLPNGLHMVDDNYKVYGRARLY